MLVSIVTVNFNHLEGLKRTYESVVNQTFGDYEWIVIDGGSTDGSREFIEQHQDHFAYWCSEKDNGIYHAMNKGIRQAKGEYLNFMNAGDTFACCETLAGVFGKQRTADILYGYMPIGNINGKLHSSFRNMKKILQWYDLYPYTLPHQASFIKRVLFEEVGMYDEVCRVVSDSLWFSKAILIHKASYEFIPNKIAIFEGGGLGSTGIQVNERDRQKQGVFPDYVHDEDFQFLRKMSLVHSYKLTAFLFRVVYRIAWEFDKRKREAELRNLSKHLD